MRSKVNLFGIVYRMVKTQLGVLFQVAKRQKNLACLPLQEAATNYFESGAIL